MAKNCPRRSNPTTKYEYGQILVMAMLSVVVISGVFIVANFPGEKLNEIRPFKWIPIDRDSDNHLVWSSPYELLIAGEIDLIGQKPKSLWSNRIIIPGISIVDLSSYDTVEKFNNLPETISLRGRHLEGAVLIDAKLPKADLTSANLRGAQLDDADLRKAKFGCATKPVENTFIYTENNCTQIQGASLSQANMQGANLDYAQLQGASLADAQLQGSSFENASMQGVALTSARLQGASFNQTIMHGVNFDFAKIVAVSFELAELQGASFYNSNIRGTSFANSNLDGSKFLSAYLDAVSFSEASIWKSTIDDSTVLNIRSQKISNQPPSTVQIERIFRLLSDAKLIIDKKLPIEGISPITDVEKLLHTKFSNTTDLGIDPGWLKIKKMEWSPKLYAKSFVNQWKLAGCSPIGQPYVILSIINRINIDPHHSNLDFDEESPENIKKAEENITELADSFLDKRCRGANGISEDARAFLQARPWNANPAERPLLQLPPR